MLDATHLYQRKSLIFEAPDLDDKNKPVNWMPVDVIVEDWGRYQIVFDGNDVTFYGGVPAQLQTMVFDEPFDDAALSITFPSVTPYVPIPGWVFDNCLVEIHRVLPDNSVQNIWEGLVGSVADQVSETDFGMTVELKGALFHLDDYVAKPPLTAIGPQDVGLIIAANFTHSLRAAPGLHCNLMTPVYTDILSNKLGSWDPTLTGFIQELLSDAFDPDGLQWTVMKEWSRTPVLRKKDLTTVNWTVYVGQPGVHHDLTLDYSTKANVIYGEGVDAGHCSWRNAKYPNITDDSGAVFPGTAMAPGYSGDDWALVEHRLIEMGFTGVVADGYYSAEEEAFVRLFQHYAGVDVDGIVGAQTWNLIFNPVDDIDASEGFNDAYFFPIAWVTPWAMPFYVSGAATPVPNPDYDPFRPRRERYINFGEPIEKGTAAYSTDQMLQRTYGPLGERKGYAGTIKLKADPQEGSKLDIRAGHNIMLKGHLGEDRLLHIASASLDWANNEAELTVDESGRDIATLVEIMNRNHENASPSWKQEKKFRNSKATEDAVAIWDCESGAGRIPYHGVTGGLWSVRRIPCAAGGQIAKAQFFADIPTRMSVGVFDRRVTANYLRDKSAGASPVVAGSNGPLDQYDVTEDLVGGYWDLFGDDEGLIIAWGDWDNAGGYYPLQETDGGDPSGVLVDEASWYFESTAAPWLWVAIWCEEPSLNYVHGQFIHGNFL